MCKTLPPPTQKKTAKPTKIHEMLHVTEFSSFTDSLWSMWVKKKKNPNPK